MVIYSISEAILVLTLLGLVAGQQTSVHRGHSPAITDSWDRQGDLGGDLSNLVTPLLDQLRVVVSVEIGADILGKSSHDIASKLWACHGTTTIESRLHHSQHSVLDSEGEIGLLLHELKGLVLLKS